MYNRSLVAWATAVAALGVACGGGGTAREAEPAPFDAGPGALNPVGAVDGASDPAGGTVDGDASGGADGATADSGGGSGPMPGSCGAGDPKLPPEPAIPSACTTLQASQTVAPGAVPSESVLDTGHIQAALDTCSAGRAVRLVVSGAKNAFITGPLTIPPGVALWVDAGATLYGTRDPKVYGGEASLITVRGAKSAIVGDGVIDGQGGEPMIGSTQSFWDANGGGGHSPALIQVIAATDFTLYRITLHNAPMFHVKLGANRFVVWGITIKTPSKATNSVGTPLTPASAHNTDGIDPGEAASNGVIVCSKITDGDDQIAIKGGVSVSHLTIAHNHFGAGHGMSIGSETNGGVSDVDVYDLSIDGTISGAKGGSSNGIRIKSDPSRGGLVTNVTYTDICTRNLANPIQITPHYAPTTGALIPSFQGVVIRDFHALGGALTPAVTLDGYDAAHVTTIQLDNVTVEGLSPSNVLAQFADVTLGPGKVNFVPSGSGVSVTNIAGSSQPNPCVNRWVSF